MRHPGCKDDVSAEAGCPTQAVQTFEGSDESNNGVRGICTDVMGRDARVKRVKILEWVEGEDNAKVVIHAVR
jgi:hypothetical protein